ncbi:MAG TPA: Nramp family divalent metal transporter [Gemmatimonadales bacterium]|nr:Nramp family divalent metal transporter [Gemmatimonadales bacterium]
MRVRLTGRRAAERVRRRVTKTLGRLGPGLVTGAANDDPGCIGTHAQVGAQFGTSLLWLAPWTLPLLAVVQEMAAQLGNIAGEGLASTLRRHYPRGVLWSTTTLLVAANLVNLAADLGVMAETLQLLVGGPRALWIVALAALLGLLQTFVPYGPYARVLKIVTLSLLAYVAGVFLVRLDWPTALRHTFVPSLAFSEPVLLAVVAVIGTRLSPYLFVWQPSQVVEEEVEEGKTTRAERQGTTRLTLRRLQLDVLAGSVMANLVTWAIMVTTAATLHASGTTEVRSAADAARALEPVAGSLAALIFTVGILGTGFLAVPVLAGGIGYVLGEAWSWRRGLGRRPADAPGFYAAILGALAIAAALNFVGVSTIRALFLSQLLNGVVAAPLVFLLLHICNNRAVMGRHVNGRLANTLGGLTALVMLAAMLGLVWSMVDG